MSCHLKRAAFQNAQGDHLIVMVPTQQGYPIDGFQLNATSQIGAYYVPSQFRGQFYFEEVLPCGAYLYIQGPMLAPPTQGLT